jgi:hypothetical protein
VEIVIPETILCQAFHGWYVDWAAKGAGLAESHVVDKDDEHIRGTGRRFNLEPRRRSGGAFRISSMVL